MSGFLPGDKKETIYPCGASWSYHYTSYLTFLLEVVLAHEKGASRWPARVAASTWPPSAARNMIRGYPPTRCSSLLLVFVVSVFLTGTRRLGRICDPIEKPRLRIVLSQVADTSKSALPHNHPGRDALVRYCRNCEPLSYLHNCATGTRAGCRLRYIALGHDAALHGNE